MQAELDIVHVMTYMRQRLTNSSVFLVEFFRDAGLVKFLCVRVPRVCGRAGVRAFYSNFCVGHTQSCHKHSRILILSQFIDASRRGYITTAHFMRGLDNVRCFNDMSNAERKLLIKMFSEQVMKA